MAKRDIEEVSPAMGQETGKKRIKVEQQQHLPDATGTNQNPPKASLLGLPAELRNRIYSLTVGAGRAFFIDSHGYREPQLLRTCATIRREARQMFFENNHFDLYFRNGKFESQPEHWFWDPHLSRNNCTLICKGKPYLENVLEWVRNFHAGIAPRFQDVEQALSGEWSEELDIGDRACAVAAALSDVSWDVVEGAIETLLEFDRLERVPDVLDEEEDEGEESEGDDEEADQ